MASGSRSLDVYGTPEVRKSVSNWIVAELKNCLPATVTEPSPWLQERLIDLGSHIERLAGDCETNQTLADYFRQIEVHLKTIRDAGIVEKMVRKEELGQHKQREEGIGGLNTEVALHPPTRTREDEQVTSHTPELSPRAGRGKMKEQDLNYN